MLTVVKRSFSEGGAISFHPQKAFLAVSNPKAGTIQMLDLDADFFTNISAGSHTIHYANAKVFLVGDSGVGKTALGLVLGGGPFEPTESTPAGMCRRFNDRRSTGERVKETRETLLWDLAGSCYV